MMIKKFINNKMILIKNKFKNNYNKYKNQNKIFSQNKLFQESMIKFKSNKMN